MGRPSLLAWLLGIAWLALIGPAYAQSVLSEGYAREVAGLKPEERAGSEIWFFATAFNDRFFTYAFPQRIGGAIDWYAILAADKKKDIFQAWGGIPDPDCCVPGDANCPAKSKDETFGLQWCPGDEALLAYVGKQGYKDPACDFKDAPVTGSDQRQSSCDLRFGTSTGVLGLRKFPNPRFNKDAWVKLNGSLAAWDGYRKPLAASGPDQNVNRLLDGSIEPPFRIGMACGACHIGYKPNDPPADPDKPQWRNIDGLIGNQYSRISNILASGFTKHALEWQLIARARPGIVDTSALPMDYVSNPGTMNAIINFAKRPAHEHDITKWRKAEACPSGADARQCWCEPGRDKKCWERSRKTEMVPNILKGGEDSIGVEEAIQRVYFNIGSCSEQCWLNHIPDLRVADPAARNHGQTPFDIGQCRRDCASFRAIEDRLPDLKAFFLSARPSDLWQARGLKSREELEATLDREFFPGAVSRGRDIYRKQCASCHSSQPEPHDTTDFHATDPADPSLRVDWLGNDKVEPASEIGTYAGRALHSNHMQSRVWSEYASHTLQSRPADPARQEVMKGGGRGYYRNVSLLSAWAHAPFMHNNAIGPEICGKPSDPAYDFSEKFNAGAPACWPYDTSIEGRYKLYVAAMREMLNPPKRLAKMHLLDTEMVVDIAPQFNVGDLEFGLSVRIPPGFPAPAINSLRFKDMIQDAVLLWRNPGKLREKYQAVLDAAQLAELERGLRRFILKAVLSDKRRVLELIGDRGAFVHRFYSNILDRDEAAGHRFGETLSDRDKDALIAFVATL